MNMKKVDLDTSVLSSNEEWAEKNRNTLRKHDVFSVNIMSSPGSGKTTILQHSFKYLSRDMKIGVVVGDVETTEDAERMKNKGVPIVQINTHGACHLDARMIGGVLPSFELEELDLLIIENVGNLVCPADFSFGEHIRVAVLSTTEGNDKIRKYPEMFRKSHAVIINKMDLLPYVEFNMDKLADDLKTVGSTAEVFPMTATKEEGVENWCHWLTEKIKTKNV